MNSVDHPIFEESIRFIKSELGETGLTPLQNEVLFRLIHTSGDFDLKNLLRFSPNACEIALEALLGGAPILTDTTMAAVAVSSMAARTLQPEVLSAMECLSDYVPNGQTKTSFGLCNAWTSFSKNSDRSRSPIVLIGSSPTALNALLDICSKSQSQPSLIIGMPVGFIGVDDSKRRLSLTAIPQIRIEGSRGGAALAAATVNALLRSAIRFKK